MNVPSDASQEYFASTSAYVNLLDGNQLSSTSGVVYKPNIEKCIECFVDSNFSS